MSETYLLLRDWKDAEEMAKRALSIDPHENVGMHVLLLSVLHQTGNIEEPLRLLASLPSNDLPIPNTGTYDMVIGSRAEVLILARDFNSASKGWEAAAAATIPERQRFAANAIIHVLDGDVAGARVDAEKAKELLEVRVREHSQDIRSLRALSWVYLALSRKTDALNVAEQTLDLLPPEKDAFLGADNLAGLAEMQAQTGAVAEAVKNLGRLLSMPAGDRVSITRLKLDPVWDPLRNDPGFQQLLRGKELVGPNR
jgi:serine/threonine-protein kinase